MNPQLLLTSLKVQDDNLDELVDLLQTKKTAIVQNDMAALEQAINDEQKILKNIEREESNRIKIIKEMAGLYSLQLPTPSMENLMIYGKSHFTKESKEIEQIRKSIKLKMGQIIRTNAQLKTVVDFSRNMIKETIMMIVGTSKRTLVNKRV